MKPAPVEAVRVIVAPHPARAPEIIDVPNPYEEDVDVAEYPVLAGFFSLAGLVP